MRIITIYFICCLISSKSFCQFHFCTDSIKAFSRLKLDTILDYEAKIDTSYDFELRFWTQPSLIAYSSVFIMSNNNGLWKARYFEYVKNSFIEIKVDQSNLDELWKGISYHQVLTLPDQNSLRKRMRKYIADSSYVFEHDAEYSSMMIMDGTRYRFELSSPGKRRFYEYHCPVGYLKKYSNIEELYRVFAIIIYIRKYLALKLEVC